MMMAQNISPKYLKPLKEFRLSYFKPAISTRKRKKRIKYKMLRIPAMEKKNLE